MPLFTYVMSFEGRTAVQQLRKSNFKGWLGEAVSAAFPQLNKEQSFDVIRCEPKPVPNTLRTWRFSVPFNGSELVGHIVETRD